MRFSLHTQTLLTKQDAVRVQYVGCWPSTRDMMASLVRGNRWSVKRDVFEVTDGALVVHYHTWNYMGVRVRSGIIESYSIVTAYPDPDLPIVKYFEATLLNVLIQRPEFVRKKARFANRGLPFEGDFCDNYQANSGHILTCNYCSKQFTGELSEAELRKREQLRAQRVRYIDRRRVRRGGPKGPRDRKKEQENSVVFKYAFCMPA